MARIQNITLEGRSNALLAASRAAQVAQEFGDAKDSTARVVALARAVRLYLEAGQSALALDRLDDYRKVVATAEDAKVTRALTGLADNLTKAITRDAAL